MALSEVQNQPFQEDNKMNDQSREIEVIVNERIQRHVEKFNAIFQRIMAKDDFIAEYIKEKSAMKS
jgi:hypothetical protein